MPPPLPPDIRWLQRLQNFHRAFERFGLRPALWACITAALLRHPAVEGVVLFGSRAKGTHRPGSDIDLALLGPRLTADDEAQLRGWLDDLDLPWFFDIVCYDHLPHAPNAGAGGAFA